MSSDVIMKILNVASDGVGSKARQARDRALALLYVCGLGMAFCMLLPISLRGQEVIATRGGGPRAILDRSTMMTKVKT